MELIQIKSFEELIQQFKKILYDTLKEIKEKDRFTRFSDFMTEKDISRATLYSYDKRHRGLLTKIGNQTYVDREVWNDILSGKRKK
ncbi:MAG: hypothetical protein KAQ62_01005 [Cyclobacteriaceae bacterium]|nr:hypothetical protein [Cyclobacteriaceae bacterium]